MNIMAEVQQSSGGQAISSQHQSLFVEGKGHLGNDYVEKIKQHNLSGTDTKSRCWHDEQSQWGRDIVVKATTQI